MHVDESVLAPVRLAYGEPLVLRFEGEVAEREYRLMRPDGRRRHDVTFFVFNGKRLALIRKPHFQRGIWRPPGGGVKPGEGFAAGVEREAREELGVEVALERYLVRAEARFTFDGAAVDWRTHVVLATTTDDELVPVDVEEIAAARWGSTEELAGPLRERLLATGFTFWRYRVALHDAALTALAAP